MHKCAGEVLETEQQCKEQAVGVLLQAQQALRRHEQMGPGQQLRIFADSFADFLRHLLRIFQSKNIYPFNKTYGIV